MNKKIKLSSTSSYIGNTPLRCPDIKKIKRLGFNQNIKIKDGIKGIIKT